MRSNYVQKLTTAAMLTAIGILIPMVSPLRVVLEPASFTLASHVPIFIAMLISPSMALAVSLCTTFGFYLGGFPLVVVLRAASHAVFAYLGSAFLHRRPATAERFGPSLCLYALAVNLIHAVCEVAVSAVFYFGGHMTDGYYSRGFFVAVILLVGVGTVVHGLVDFAISYGVVAVLRNQRSFAQLVNRKAPSPRRL